jgi:N-acetylmuramoyl-L-alanine amidase CwlA|nr:MAG TPA: N-acetylmuramoyl-L-alanine amidase [Caudoviricetes sp.]
MNIKELLSHPTNYTATGSRTIKYLVIHYTGNNGDTAAGNCNYFTGANRQASAHYFVDEKEVWRSVRDGDRAWHCGDDVYFHPACRNNNSIGIELCSRRDASGRYYFKPETLARAVELTKAKMQEYNIPAENVVRHYDVTHKICPAPFVEDVAAWQAFKNALTQEDDTMQIYKTIKDVPEWARPTLQKLINDKSLSGDGQGNINVSDDFCRTMVVLDRRGKL